VLRSLFIKNNPILTAKGEYRYNENGENKNIPAVPIHIYENNVVALPPNLSARRVPFCFITAIEKSNYEITLRLDTGETYTYAKIGYDTDIFVTTVEKQLRKLREESLIAIKEINPTLTTVQASQIAKIMPQGVAAPIGKIAEIAPSFKEALENKIATSRANQSYTILKKLCDPTQIFVGLQKNEKLQDTDNLSNTISESANSMLHNSTYESHTFETSNSLTNTNNEHEETKTGPSNPYLLWLIAPSPDGQFATVEFAEADSATFVYTTNGNFTTFARQINRALEAINFKREVIRMTDQELQKPENADCYMAAKRTTALHFVRSNFVGRIIHSNMKNWEQKLIELWNSTQTTTIKSAST
jgi:hypothetical protein